MFTLRIIFVGLIAVVPSDSGSTAVLVDVAQGHHQPYVFTLAGQCVSGSEACQQEALVFGPGAPSPALQWNLDGWSAALSGVYGASLAFEAGRPSSSVGPVEMPSGPEQVADTSWLPSLGWIFSYANIDPDPLPGCTTGAGGDCPVSGRLLLPEGSLETCHLAHDWVLRIPANRAAEACLDLAQRSASVGTDRVFKFRIGDYAQALGNAFMIETRIDSHEVVLQAWPNADWPPADRRSAPRKAKLRPDADGQLTLVVMNEPIFELREPEDVKEFWRALVPALLPLFDETKAQMESLSSLVSPDLKGLGAGYGSHLHAEHTHFRHFYDMFEMDDGMGNKTALASSGLPVPEMHPDRTRVWATPGRCEPYLECLDALLFWDPLFRLVAVKEGEVDLINMAFPHAASQCDVATYP